MAAIHNMIMLVEDDDLDADVMEQVVRKKRPDVNFIRMENGAEALTGLMDKGEMPDLILMDIKMPIMDGKETLAKIKADSRLHAIPVVMMSTSNDSDDIRFCYGHCANAYVVKPLGADVFEQLANKLLDFWLDASVH